MEMQAVVIDIAAAMRQAKTGTLRAAVFVGSILKWLEAGIPESVAVPGTFRLNVAPDPLPDFLRQQAAEELPQWAISNALTDLDLFFSVYIDTLWDGLYVARQRLGDFASPNDIKKISDITSSARKHKMLIQAIAPENADLLSDNGHLCALTEARNCIAHNFGVVDERRAPKGTFVLSWLDFRLVAMREGLPEVEIRPEDLPWETDVEATLAVRIVETKKAFSLGQRVMVNAQDLLLICFLYQAIIDRTGIALEGYLRNRGISLSQ